MEERDLWIIGTAVIGLGAVVWIARVFEKKRTAALEGVSMRLGMSFQAKDPTMADEEFTRCHLFQRGKSKQFQNVARGSDVHVFGYRYVTGSGKNKTTHTQTVAALRVAGASLPAFQITPEGFFGRIGSAFRGGDIDFAEDPEFSKRYRLRAEDEAAARSMIHSGVRQQLVSEKGWCLEGDGDWLVLYKRSKRIKPDEFPAFVEHARRMAQMFS